jgi:hypothetical protein
MYNHQTIKPSNHQTIKPTVWPSIQPTNQPTMHSALLLTSSGQIDVTKWNIGSNDINHSTSKYKENKEIYHKK